MNFRFFIALILMCLSLTRCAADILTEDVEETVAESTDEIEEENESDTLNGHGSQTLAGGGSDSLDGEQEDTFDDEPAYTGDETWAIYWYVCGSDLETEGGFASMDLWEMGEVDLPENVQVVIETGGSYEWQNEVVDPNYLERYLYDESGLELVDQQPNASMGDADTLADFLDFCVSEYPADHQAVILWNHGGGTAGGVCMDEIYDYDGLSLEELYEAFDSVFELSTDEPPLDLVGFDACLMATIDTAYTLWDVAEYMVASEETEPANGWNYYGWLQALADNPGMDGEQLGIEICDSYLAGCEEYGTEDEVTLSVVKLGMLEPLMLAYEEIGKEALTYACENPEFLANFGRGAMRSENYGGNTPDEGYSNLVDLYDLIENNENILPENAQSLLEALEDCVVYRVNGAYRSEASGLSCYYSYNGDLYDYYDYCEVAAGESFVYLYGYELEGELSAEGQNYIGELGYEELQDIPELDEFGEISYPVTLDEDGSAVLILDEEVTNRLKGVYFQLAYVDEEDEFSLFLGRDNNIYADWENGVFTENFWGTWGAIDGYLCYMELIYEGDDYNLYTVPVLLNGEEYNLHVVYDYNDEQYYILGGRKGIEEETGMADRNLVQLQPGDEITTIHYGMYLSEEEDYGPVEVDTFTVTEDTVFEDVDMGDGTFALLFELVDCKNESSYSDLVWFTVENGEIYTEIY